MGDTSFPAPQYDVLDRVIELLAAAVNPEE